MGVRLQNYRCGECLDEYLLLRLDRISSLPIIKDLEKMERLRRMWVPWFRKWTETPDDPALWPLGWALEEYRVSLFAPDVPCIAKVSEKRIGEMVAACGKTLE